MYLNPDRMTTEQQNRVVEWLQANGHGGDPVALEPVVIRGGVVEFTVFDMKRRWSNKWEFPTRRRRLRIRHKFRASEVFA